MAVFLSPVGGAAAQFFTNTGAVLTGGKIYTYLAGTTTPATTYTTSAGNVARTNPIVLDAAGRVPGGGEIWLTQGVVYKFTLTDSSNVLIATYDNISGISELTLPIDSSNITYDPPFTASVATNVEAKLAQTVSVIDFGAVGDGTANDSAAITAAVTAAAGRNLFFPEGTYRVSSNITIPELVCCVLEPNAKFSIDSGVTVKIFGPVVATNFPYWTGSGTMQSYAFQQNNQRTTIWQEPASPLSNADIFLSNIRDKMFQIIATSQLPTSTTSVTAGTGLKTWFIQPGLRLAEDLGVNMWAHRDSDGLYMQGFIDAYNNTTGELTLNVFNNQLASATSNNWYFTVASDPFSVFQYGGASKGASQGLYCQVASAGGSSRPYNYVIALYGGNGTVPCLFGLPNGGTGFGTEVPNQRIHVVGANGTQTSGIRLTESLPLERGLTAYPHTGGYSVLGSYDWDGAADYPLRFTSQARAQMDFNKTCPVDSSVLIATVSLPNYGAVYVKVQAGGIVAGGGGVGAYSEFKLSRDTGNVTITPVTQSNWGYGSAGWYRIEENVNGANAEFYLLMNSAGGSPGTWNGIGNLEVMGKAVVTMA